MISATQTMIQTYTCSVKLRTHTSPQETRSPSETNHKLPGKYMVFVSFLTHVFLCFVGSTHVVSIGVFLCCINACFFLCLLLQTLGFFLVLGPQSESLEKFGWDFLLDFPPLGS